MRHRERAQLARGERGSVMLLVVVILAALLAGGAIALSLVVSDTRSSQFANSSRSALFCAESGLAAARGTIAANSPVWNEMLDADPSNDPTWYPIRGDLDGDLIADYEVIIRDNGDEFSPTPDNPNEDNDAKVFVVSRCIRFPNYPRAVMELVTFQSASSNYKQRGLNAQGTGTAP